MKTQIKDRPAYLTKDGSEIRELLHPDHHSVTNQSLAEARIPAGVTTHLHRHHRSEEIYHITSGTGVMRLEDKVFSVTTGDSVLISPGTAHSITNNGKKTLVVLCCCAPAYSHEDTELLSQASEFISPPLPQEGWGEGS
ncbi:MAG: cupin domain-containing protein [Candidatus Sedimenticola sp. (ex Thyasira tokunagai)]